MKVGLAEESHCVRDGMGVVLVGVVWVNNVYLEDLIEGWDMLNE